MKKILSLIIIILILTLSGCQKPKEDIYIFYTGDVHCGIDSNLGYPAVKAIVDETKAEHSNVLLVDTGDYLQGGMIGSMSRGSYIVDLMNQMDYDLVTFGNHEFDYDMDRLSELMDMAEFGFIASNAVYSGSKTSVFENVPAYVIKDFQGTKVAFLGVLTPETLTSSTPVYFMEDNVFVYDFYSGNNGKDLSEQVQKTVDEVRSKGADYVVVLSHLGSETQYAPYDAITLISNTTGIDVVIDGHSHSVVYGDPYPNAAGEDVILTASGTKLENLGELIIATDGTISAMLISEYDKEDEEIANSIMAIYDELNVTLNEKIGELEFPLVISDENGIRQVRSRETNLGDFCADALRFELFTDIAIVNGGGIRKTVEAGDVTYGNLLDVMPFGNTTASCYATGQQILDALEFASRSADALYVFEENAVGENGAFMQVSGLKYTIDTSIPSGVLLDDDGMFIGIEGERRVKDVLVLQDGEYVPIDPEMFYTVGSTDYVLFKNGDGNTIFHDCERIIANGETDVDLLIRFFKNQDSFEAYREVQDRITVK
ncbi:MAG: bifunctional metallophosphatase/5'-nucleotidase [Erysipelotrichaceae bacterium]|nr:bifunctional metallophosphatase/5'-nucleotidase [Erysipelotrichaceae bacterium]